MKPVDSYFEHFYFEILVHNLRSRRLLVDMVGASQIVIGSNLGGWDSANGVAMLEELDLSTAEHDLIAFQNSADLLNLELAVGPRSGNSDSA